MASIKQRSNSKVEGKGVNYKDKLKSSSRSRYVDYSSCVR